MKSGFEELKSAYEALEHVAVHGWPKTKDVETQHFKGGRDIDYNADAVKKYKEVDADLKRKARNIMNWLDDNEAFVLGCEYEISKQISDCIRSNRPCGYLKANGSCDLGRK